MLQNHVTFITWHKCMYLCFLSCDPKALICTPLTFSFDSTGKRKCQKKRAVTQESTPEIAQDMWVTEHTRKQSRQWGEASKTQGNSFPVWGHKVLFPKITGQVWLALRLT